MLYLAQAQHALGEPDLAYETIIAAKSEFEEIGAAADAGRAETLILRLNLKS